MGFGRVVGVIIMKMCHIERIVAHVLTYLARAGVVSDFELYGGLGVGVFSVW